MIYLLMISFFGLLGFMILASYPETKLLTNKKTKRRLLDLLTASLSGFLFVVLVRLFEAGGGGPEGSSFSLSYDVLDNYMWKKISRDNVEDFFFGFIVTYIIIFIRDQYKKL